jgi:hypothetical protein
VAIVADTILRLVRLAELDFVDWAFIANCSSTVVAVVSSTLY